MLTDAETGPLFIGRNTIRIESTASTNDALSSLLGADGKKLPEGSILITGNQSAGKGQRGAVWESEPGKNLTFSILFYPEFLSVADSFQLSKAVALGISDALDEILKLQVQIKWPNDIYIGDKKTGGILIENTIRSGHILSSVIGIGINVNQTEFGSKLPNPTSLSIVSAQTFDLEYVLQLICSYIEARYLKLKSGNRISVDADFHAKLYGLGERKIFHTHGESFTGNICGVSNEGRLEIKVSSGEKRVFDVKEIVYR